MEAHIDHFLNAPAKQGMQIRKGDVVEVRSAAEILATLDDNGTLEGLPFMPEMIEFCGKTFQVARRAEKTCVDGHPEAFREFRNNDVVLLEELRCSGVEHAECQRGCMLFWKEAWLRKVTQNEGYSEIGNGDKADRFREKLKTTVSEDQFFCQSSQLERATQPLPRWRRFTKIYQEVHVGNKSYSEAANLFLAGIRWKVRGLVMGRFPSGPLSKTPTEALELQPGDWVEVKPYKEIHQTLDKAGKNRGMQFDLDMRMFCGKRYQVKRRLDRMIREDSGEMLTPKNTVILAGVDCQCIFATGGCPRAEAFYWREIWLQRVDGPTTN